MRRCPSRHLWRSHLRNTCIHEALLLRTQQNCATTKVALYLSGLAGSTSQSLNGMHELSELVLARIALFVDQSCSWSVLPLRSAKAREFEELWRESLCMHVGPCHLNLSESVLLGRPERTNEKLPKSLCKERLEGRLTFWSRTFEQTLLRSNK